MWARNLLFTGVTFGGLALVAGFLFPSAVRLNSGGSPEPFRSEDEYQRQVIEQVNDDFQRHWHSLGISPTLRTNDLTIARRLSLGLTGTIPSLEELRAFEARAPAERVGMWLNELLSGRRYADYVAERLARAVVGTEEGPFLVFRRRRFASWLSDRLHENAPYNDIVRALISDTGLWTDSPAVNFITVTSDQNQDNDPDEVRLAGRTVRAFLGARLDCVQCHDDNLGGDWRQADFHQLASFFVEARSSLTGIQDTSRPYNYQYLGHDSEEVVPAGVPFRSDLLEAHGTRRQRLARWVTHPENSAFARATVNRVWALMFGRPLVEPIDDIPLEGPYPPGLETLAEDFSRHGFDLRRLIGIIAATDVFQRDSRGDHEITPRHEEHWAAFPLSRLRPEQVAGALLQAARLTTINAQSHIFVRLARASQLNDFVERYGDTGEDEFAAHGGTIPQRLLLMNGEVVKERTKQDLLTNAATRIAVLAPDDASAIEAAYLAILTRQPTPGEAAHFEQRLENTRGPRRIGHLEDLYWTLINSAEFSWNH